MLSCEIICFGSNSLNSVAPIILLKSGMKRRIDLMSALELVLKEITASIKRCFGVI